MPLPLPRASATAPIRGRVLMAGSDVPVRKARVSATAEGGTALETVYTNGEGRFTLTMPPGRYAIAA